MALLFLGSWFVMLYHAAERDHATLDALATHITLDERPKTLLGLAVTACAAKWLRRRLWIVDFDSLAPSDQAVRVVTDSGMRMDCASQLGSKRSCHPKSDDDGPRGIRFQTAAEFTR
jgi:hypothetical protein